MADFREPVSDQWGVGLTGSEGSDYLNAGTGENNVPATPSVGFSWSNPERILTEALGSSTLVTSGGAPYIMPYLRASNYGFAIPAAATMLGVEVQFLHTGGNSDYTEDEVKLAWGASAANLSTTNKADLGSTPSNSETKVYGGPTDLWGETAGTLTPTVINSSDFGYVLKFGRASGSAGRTVAIDAMRITIYYSNATGTGNARVTQVYSETIISQKADARVSQVYAESIVSVKEDALVSQVYAEVLHGRNFVSNVPAGRRQSVIVTAT